MICKTVYSIPGRCVRWAQLSLAALALSGIISGTGCVNLDTRRSFVDVGQPDLKQVIAGARPHLVHVTLKKTTPETRRRVGTVILRSPASTQLEPYTGIVVSDDGYVLLPFSIESTEIQDVTVWVGEEEQDATFVAHDKQLGMTIIQVENHDKLAPLPLRPTSDVAPGQWFAVLSTSGEDAYFAPRTGLFMVCSRRPTRYPELEIDGIGKPTTGAPLLNRHGRPVGIVKSETIATVLSEPFCADLSQFIEMSVAGEPEDEDKDKAYFGACLQDVNPDHARYLNVEKSALWVVHVLPGAPADKAGLKAGDLILAVDGDPVRYSGNRARSDFNWRMERKKFAVFALTVWRDGETLELKCKREKRPEFKEFESKELGVVVRDIDENIFAHRNLATHEGVMVSDVRAGSPASTSNKFGQSLIRKDDVIVELNGVPTPDIASFTKVAEEIRKVRPNAVLVKYLRGRITGFDALNLNIGSTSNGAKQ